MANVSNLMEIDLDRIRVSELNTRKDLQAGNEDSDIEDLANSIRARGLINPVTVVPRSDGGYDLIAGQRAISCMQATSNAHHFCHSSRESQRQRGNGDFTCRECPAGRHEPYRQGEGLPKSP